MDMTRPYDLVVLGATGFTGRLVAHHLGERLAGTDVSWAIAGRRTEALEAVRDELDHAGEGRSGATPHVEVVDVSDLVGLLDLAARTHVVASTAGPFGRLGELVAQACVRSGTHYCDTTGEPAYFGLLRARYHRDAERRGVRLVPACAFEAVPADLGARLAAQRLPQNAPIQVRGYLAMDAAWSGGTARTAVEALQRGRARAPARNSGDGVRPVGLLPQTVHHVPELGSWAVPMPTIDPAVVLRSAQLLDGYGTVFRYGHYLRARGPVHAAGLAVAGAAAVTLAKLPPARRALQRVLPESGDGPSPERRARSWFSAVFLAESGDGPDRVRAHARLAGGDPGYDETAVMLGEAALALAHDPPPPRAGVLTPASGLGERYLTRLREMGLHVAANGGESHLDAGPSASD